MEGKLCILLALMMVAVVCAAPPDGPEKHVKADKTACRVIGKSGKIACHKELAGECDDMPDGNTTMPTQPPTTTGVTGGTTGATTPAGDDKKDDKDDKDKCQLTAEVEVSISSIQELANETAITTNGHSQTSFGGTDFTLEEPVEDVDIPNTSPAVKGTKLSMHAELDDGATFTIDIYIATADGTVSIDGEEQEIKKGMMKFSIGVENWVFCTEAGDCGGAVGTKLEVEMELKSRGTPTKVEDDDSKFDLGGNAVLQVSGKVQLDGTWGDMEDGYPTMTSKANKNYLVVRFNKANKVVYDPLTDFGDWASDGEGPISGAVTSYMTSSLACLLTVLAAMFV